MNDHKTNNCYGWRQGLECRGERNELPNWKTDEKIEKKMGQWNDDNDDNNNNNNKLINK